MYKVIKRTMDIAVSLTCLIILSPLMAAIALLIWHKMGLPVLFRQSRIGFREKTFTVLKFRTMNDECGIDGKPLSDIQRITRLGAFLRKTSLDELPQLINVLKGDMSLVGPRPLFISYLPYYTEREKKRHDVTPGITGLAQLNGRNRIPWEDRLELDVQYVENKSICLDLSILIRTPFQVVTGKNILVVPGTERVTLDEHRRRTALENASIPGAKEEG